MEIHKTVGLLVVEKGKILLIERLNEPSIGMLALPGGHVDGGETVKEAAVREAHEEVNGVEVVGNPVHVFNHDVGENESNCPEKHKHECYVFACKVSGNIVTGSDAGKFIWLDPRDFQKYGPKITDSSQEIIRWYLDQLGKLSCMSDTISSLPGE